MVTKDRRFREGKGGDGPGPGSYEVSGAHVRIPWSARAA